MKYIRFSCNMNHCKTHFPWLVWQSTLNRVKMQHRTFTEPRTLWPSRSVLYNSLCICEPPMSHTAIAWNTQDGHILAMELSNYHIWNGVPIMFPYGIQTIKCWNCIFIPIYIDRILISYSRWLELATVSPSHICKDPSAHYFNQHELICFWAFGDILK